MTPVVMIGINFSDTVARVEKAYTLLSKVAVTAGKFANTKEGQTAVYWLAWSDIAKGVQAASLMASPTYGTAAIRLALFCSTAYGIDTIIGSKVFASAEFLNQATIWCARRYGFLAATSILPKDALNLAIKFLEGLKSLS